MSFAPVETSLAWNCIVALGLLYVGQRYQDQSLMNAADLQHVGIVSKIRVAVEGGVQSINYDTLAAITLLGALSVSAIPVEYKVQVTNVLQVTRFWLGKSSRADEGVLHGIGLSAVLEAMKPEQFQTDQSLALFEYMRFTIIMTSLLTGRPTSLASEPWRMTPWARAKHAKGSMHVLIDLLCDIIPLQSEKHFMCLIPDRAGPTASSIKGKVSMLMQQLYDWRQSVEPGFRIRLKTIDGAGQSTLIHTGAGYPIQFEKPQDLFQLGLFNMILIYLCRYLTEDETLSQATDPQTQSSVMQGCASNQTSILPTTPLTLPVPDPITRATTAAKEICVIWKCLTKDGLFGCASFYMSVPLVVAKVHLVQVGDAEASELDEAIDRIPSLWAGRT